MSSYEATRPACFITRICNIAKDLFPKSGFRPTVETRGADVQAHPPPSHNPGFDRDRNISYRVAGLARPPAGSLETVGSKAAKTLVRTRGCLPVWDRFRLADNRPLEHLAQCPQSRTKSWSSLRFREATVCASCVPSSTEPVWIGLCRTLVTNNLIANPESIVIAPLKRLQSEWKPSVVRGVDAVEHRKNFVTAIYAGVGQHGATELQPGHSWRKRTAQCRQNAVPRSATADPCVAAHRRMKRFVLSGTHKVPRRVPINLSINRRSHLTK